MYTCIIKIQGFKWRLTRNSLSNCFCVCEYISHRYPIVKRSLKFIQECIAVQKEWVRNRCVEFLWTFIIFRSKSILTIDNIHNLMIFRFDLIFFCSSSFWSCSCRKCLQNNHFKFSQICIFVPTLKVHQL